MTKPQGSIGPPVRGPPEALPNPAFSMKSPELSIANQKTNSGHRESLYPETILPPEPSSLTSESRSIALREWGEPEIGFINSETEP